MFTFEAGIMSTPAPSVHTAADDNYSLTVITVTSLALNGGFFVMLLVRLSWRLVQSFTSLGHPQTSKVLLPIITDELLNTVLIGLAVYCCLTLDWPRDYLKSPPLTVITLVCANVARYVFRIVLITDHTSLENNGHVGLKLSHHLIILAFLSAILAYRAYWWYGVIVITMEMDNILSSMRRSIKVINKPYWKAIELKYSVIQITSKILFRFILPGTLVIMYVGNMQVKHADVPRGGFYTTTLGCLLIACYEFYSLVFSIHRLVKSRSDSMKLTQVTSTNNFNNNTYKQQLLSSGLVLPNQFKLMVENDVKTTTTTKDVEKNCLQNHNICIDLQNEAKMVPFKQTANVNADHAPSREKQCEKILIGRIQNDQYIP